MERENYNSLGKYIWNVERYKLRHIRNFKNEKKLV